MLQRVTITNGEKVTGGAVTLYDLKNKPIPGDGPPPDGTTIVWTAIEPAPPDGGTIAQIVQDEANGRSYTVTTEGDDTGVVTFSADITKPDGTKILDADGQVPQLEVTVINSAANSASVSVGAVVPE